MKRLFNDTPNVEQIEHEWAARSLAEDLVDTRSPQVVDAAFQ